ncbi:16S rRNA (cytosine(1402)-N(4))-methyltransferase RsmH [Alcaligenes endophyticus]|uniref:Ribosomal RNA small subunit methyltransferase H n=1 Tax=Alcaligenes endophyticus TaxID=1929088 RepID=A0ABT8EMK8_9BURK|nr:16S rRNA (cytosine(1402)-N(4))-methyltransferase RsmH [Alcaligenes endophyticus]MCX5591587.1 16S rRNA (cytosine(1402)-N(4))-methyltransferase RsmH [Alcaligenes endophyticus]MDN4122532.1 16S rRNA (cytosine(1402)-N(4))-methyltransferase RsmH [Alcaligenes endophyticus]
MELVHRSVLLEPTVAALVDPEFEARRWCALPQAHGQLRGTYVDCTFGRGGHSRLLLSFLASDARLVVFDKDPQAIAVAQQMAATDSRILVVHSGFADLATRLDELEIAEIDGLMMDLGISSPQVDDADRGFSFMRNGPLDMRMDTSSGLTAEQWLAQASIEVMKEVIAEYGEERFAFQIAKAIADRRQSSPLHTTHDLAELVASVVRTREKGHHPATRTFQAIRIYLNRELEELAYALPAVLRRLKYGGRLAVIAFHSLEDRMVKQFMAAAARPGQEQARLPIMEKDMPQPWLHSLGRILPTPAESKDNPRARSAVLRVAQRTAEPLDEVWMQQWSDKLTQMSGLRAQSSRGRK